VDLIPKQYKQQNQTESTDPGVGIKSRGISISGKGADLSFLYNKWVLISLGGFLFSVLAFGALYGYDFYLAKQSAKLDAQIDQLKSEQRNQQNVEIIKKISNIDSTIATVNNLMKKHIYSSAFFTSLESLTLPQVQWNSLALDCLAGTADLSGRAASYSFLAKQIVSFQNGKVDADVAGISLGSGGVNFSAKIKFDQSILLK